MARQQKRLDDLSDYPAPDPASLARQRAERAAIYAQELRRRAEAAGLMDSPIIQERIRQADAEAAAAAAQLQ